VLVFVHETGAVAKRRVAGQVDYAGREGPQAQAGLIAKARKGEIAKWMPWAGDQFSAALRRGFGEQFCGLCFVGFVPFVVQISSLPMPSPLPPCPHLPAARPGLDWRTLHVHREDVRGAEFYRDCLEYGQALWQRRLAARALLCLDRAMGADLDGSEPVLREWPMPYAAMAWLIAQTPADVFVGNPRVHFQHYADRMNEPRREQRRWRAWACWALARGVRPDLPGDPNHQVHEPTREEIAAGLNANGLPGEAELWGKVLAGLPA
jgi:hypothetical protein